MDNNTKEKIAAKFSGRPLFYLVVRALLFKPWFRIVFVLFIFTPVVAVVVLAKIWRTTPPGFNPVVYVSGLDFMQAWALKRTALKEFQSDHVAEAIRTWRTAIANNPGNVPMLRNFLEQVNQRIEPPEFQSEVIPMAVWLIRLTGTNLVDLEITGNLFLKYGFDAYVLSLLGPKQSSFGAGLHRLYLKALFNEDRIENFLAHWQKCGGQQLQQEDTELALCWAAYEGGWGTPETNHRGQAHLEKLFEDPVWRVKASRLYLKTCEKRGQVESFFATLERLQSWRKDSIRDHIRGWRLLAAKDRKAEAIRLATEFPSRPMTAFDTLLLTEAYSFLGMREQALQTLDRFTLEFSFFDQLWVMYGNLLVEAQQWDKARQLAIKMRTHRDVGARLSALSYYLEGRADVGLDRRNSAEGAFAKIASLTIDDPNLAFSIGRSLQRLGYPKYAKEILWPLRQSLQSQLDFWGALSLIAFELKDAELLVQTTGEALRVAPNNANIKQDHAAALLSARQRPEEAIKYMMELVQQSPRQPAAILNYAAALIQNRRIDEVQRLLASLDYSKLSHAEKVSYDVTRFELLIHAGRYDEARRVHQQIDTATLFPIEVKHLDKLREKLPGS